MAFRCWGGRTALECGWSPAWRSARRPPYGCTVVTSPAREAAPGIGRERDITGEQVSYKSAVYGAVKCRTPFWMGTHPCKKYSMQEHIMRARVYGTGQQCCFERGMLNPITQQWTKIIICIVNYRQLVMTVDYEIIKSNQNGLREYILNSLQI